MKKILITTAVLLSQVLCVRAQDLFSENFENTTNGALPVGWQITNDPGAVWKTGKHADFLVQYCGSEIHYGKYAGIKPDVAYTLTQREDVLTFPPVTLQNTTTYTTLTLQMDYLYTASGDSALLEMSINNGSSWDIVQPLYPNAWWPTFTTLPTITNTSTLLLRIRHKTMAMGNFCFLSIDNIHVYVPQAVDAQVYSTTPLQDSLHNVGAPTQGPKVSAVVYNRSMIDLQSFVVKYQLDNGTVQSETVTSPTLSFGGFTTVNFTAPCTVPTMGPHQLKVWVEATGDGDNINDTVQSVVHGAGFMPVRRPLIEEHGGTWCTWCPRGYVYCDSIDGTYGDLVSIVEIHNQDPMTIQPYDSFFSISVLGGYQVPGTVFDRREPNDPDQVFVMYDKYKQYYGVGEVDLGNAVHSGNNLSIEARFKPAMDITTEYKFLLVLTEDSVHKDSTGYEQNNNYSYQQLNSPMSGFELLPAYVPAAQMWYNHVARQSVGNIAGTVGSLPLTMTYNNTYTYTFNTVLDPNWDFDRMEAVLMVIKASDSTVVNTKHGTLTSFLGAHSVQKKQDKVTVYPNPAHDVAYISVELANSGHVKMNLTDIYGRMLYSKEFSNVQKGQQTFAVSVNELPSGIYNLQVETAAGTTSRKINIIK